MDWQQPRNAMGDTSSESAPLRRGSADPRSRLPLARVLWLAPAAYALHWVEELVGFPQWVTAHFPVTFSVTQFMRNGVIFMGLLVGLSLLVARYRSRTSALLLLTYVLGLLLHNGLFHLGATLILRCYAPGLVTGLLLSIPMSLLLATAVLREGLVSRLQVAAAFVVGGVVHSAVIIAQLS